MTEPTPLKRPWLVAVWPGMGNVALTAGYYLMSKLDMEEIREFALPELFDVEQVEVKEGIVQRAEFPRYRAFAYGNPDGEHDIVVFIGEAQLPLGRFAFCRRIVEFARELGVERILTFAAMATDLQPAQRSRVFGVATDRDGVDELTRLEVDILSGGQIAGLNGVLLAAAIEQGVQGMGLLGELPLLATTIPYPRASHVVLEAFSTLAHVQLDLTELERHGQTVERNLVQMIDQVQELQRRRQEGPSESFPAPEPAAESEGELSPKDRERIEELFERAGRDRSKAFELKQELDRLGVFKEYEDRFLDLFKKKD